LPVTALPWNTHSTFNSPVFAAPFYHLAEFMEHSRYSSLRRVFMIRAVKVILLADNMESSFEFSELFDAAFRIHLPSANRYSINQAK